MDDPTKARQRQMIHAAYAAGRRRRGQAATAALLCEAFTDAIAELDRIDDVDVLLTVDTEAQPDNVVSMPIVRRTA